MYQQVPTQPIFQELRVRFYQFKMEDVPRLYLFLKLDIFKFDRKFLS